MGTDEAIGIRVVVPRGNLLGGEAEALRRRLGEALAAGFCQVVVDMRPACYVSARALGALLAHLDELRQRGGDLKLLACRPAVRQLFDLCGLGAVFEFLDTEEQIAASFGPQLSEPERQQLLEPSQATIENGHG
ncbi:MAG: STAS domain-containing protein [Candidatus Brocadiia bacterium]